MTVTANAKINPTEQTGYVRYLEDKYKRKLKSLDIRVDGDFADLSYEFEPMPIERIRRITGYLVGSMSSWNNAKTAEEHDRVKHMDMNGKAEQI